MSEHVADVPVGITLWDRIGIWLSGICMAHCVALPVVLLLLPLWPVLQSAHAWVHPAFAVLLLATTLPAAWGAWKRHARPSLSVFLLLGLAVVFVGLAAGQVAGPLLEDGITLIGSGMLIVGHWKNGRACANQACTHPH